jgi:predicted fused transcriptional regulator/phosphomethylpyrimidine kinase
VRQFGLRAVGGSDAVADVASAVRILEASDSFAAVMPEVSVNIACLAGEGETPDDVVAVPGRIVKVGGHAKSMQPPAAGSSKHLASLLLLARRRDRRFRAVINLRYDERMARVLRRLGLKTVEVEGYPVSPGGDPTLAALAAAIPRSSPGFGAVVDRGSKGIEPNVYLFGDTAVRVAERAVRVSAMYLAR